MIERPPTIGPRSHVALDNCTALDRGRRLQPYTVPCRYFSRLWCVYELAIFRALRPCAPVRIMPLRLSMALLLMQVFYVSATGLYVALWGWLAQWGILSFYLLGGSCTFFALSGMAVVGHDVARQQRGMLMQLESFDARAASCYSECDRAEIYASIVDVYDDLDSFNSTVRTTLKEHVLSELRSAERMLPYHTAVVGCSLPLVGFGWYMVSWFRRADVHTQLSFALYTLTFCFVAVPLVTSWTMARGARLPLAAESAGLPDTIRRHWRAYACIGLRGVFYVIGVWTSMAYVGVIAIASTADGTVLGLRHSDSVTVAVAANLPVVVAAIYEFSPSARCAWRRERRLSRDADQLVLETLRRVQARAKRKAVFLVRIAACASSGASGGALL